MHLSFRFHLDARLNTTCYLRFHINLSKIYLRVGRPYVSSNQIYGIEILIAIFIVAVDAVYTRLSRACVCVYVCV